MTDVSYRAIFRARYNVAVTCVVAFAPKQHVANFCCSELETLMLVESFTTLPNCSNDDLARQVTTP